MSQTNNKKTRSMDFKDMLFGSAVCIISGFICWLVFSILMSIIIASSDWPDGVLTVMAFLGLMIFAAVTGFLTGKAYIKNRFTAGLVHGIVLDIIWIIANIVSFRAQMTALTFVKLILIIAVTVLCAVLPKKSKKRQNRR